MIYLSWNFTVKRVTDKIGKFRNSIMKTKSQWKLNEFRMCKIEATTHPSERETLHAVFSYLFRCWCWIRCLRSIFKNIYWTTFFSINKPRYLYECKRRRQQRHQHSTTICRLNRTITEFQVKFREKKSLYLQRFSYLFRNWTILITYKKRTWSPISVQ